MIRRTAIKTLLNNRLNIFNLDISVIDRYTEYANLLIDTNKNINLTALKTPEDIVIKHFVDSLYGSEFIPIGSSVVDIGSGAGFPGLALAIARPDISVTLMESIGKKISFLDTVINTLGIKNAQTSQIRAERAGRGEYRQKFDIVTARGVARLNTLLEYALPMLKVGGQLLAYKGCGIEEEIALSKNAINVLNANLVSNNKFLLDNQHTRYITVIQKLAPTDKVYPRCNKKIKSQPL